MLVNYHCHSILSSDGHASMADMARAARDAGIGLLCFTDHCDMLDGQGRPQEVFDWDAEEAALAEARAAVPELELRLGVELGCPTQDPAHAERVLSRPGIDFVLGSVHNCRGGQDYYYIRYPDVATARREMDDYLDQVLELARSPYYDVLGHLDYPVRYMRQQGLELEISPEHPAVQAIFRAVIDSGRGIECNTSGYRNGGSFTMPSRALLAAYRAAGGTRLTIGTDAHRTDHLDLGLRPSLQTLRELGFRELTVYRDRRPAQIPLPVNE